MKICTTIIHNGDHAEYKFENANTPPEQRSDWPLPSFDAHDWAEAFCKAFPEMDEGVMISWFANALMRGFDEHAMRAASIADVSRCTRQQSRRRAPKMSTHKRGPAE